MDLTVNQHYQDPKSINIVLGTGAKFLKVPKSQMKLKDNAPD
jgi:hypothetical protein